MKRISLFAFLALFCLFGFGQTIFTENFETGLNSFANDASNTVNWTVNTSYYHGGSQCINNAHSSNNTNIVFQSDSLDLSATNAPEISFWHIAKTEGAYDKCYVDVSTDGGVTYTTLPSSAYLGSAGDYSTREYFHEDSYTTWGTSTTTPVNATWWKEEKFSLASYKTSNVKVRFRLVSDGSSNRAGWYMDDVLVYDVQCAAPTALTATAISSVTATLGWTAPATAPASGYEYAYSATRGTPSAGTAVPSGTSASIGGLTAQTTYYWYVRSDCGGSGTSIWVEDSFETACGTISSFPYTESFDATTSTPTCWEEDASNTEAWKFATSADYGAGSDHTSGSGNMAYIDDSSPHNANPSGLKTPFFDLTSLSVPRLVFYYQNKYSANTSGTSKLYIDVYDGTSWSAGVDSVVTDVTSWTKYTVDLTSYSSANTQIRFRVVEDASGYQSDPSLDDVTVEETPSCIEPSAPIASAITATTATLGWTAPSSAPANGYEYAYSAFRGTPSAGTPVPITSDFIGGLTAQTTYYWYVRSDCGGSGPSIWVEDSFETACGAVTSFPSTTDFTTFLPSVCWSEAVDGDLVTGPTGTTSNWTQDDWLNSTSNTKCAKTNIYSTGDDEWLISETFAIPSSSAYRLKYNVGATQYNSTAAPTIAWGTDDTVQVLISITGTTNWTELVAYNAANVPSHTGQLEIIDLTAYAGQTITIAFRAREGTTSGGDIDFFIDDVTVEETPSCIEPLAPIASAITATTATLGWTAPSSAPANGYEYAYSATRGTPSAGTPLPTTSASIGGLTAQTTYYWYVRSDCGGSGTSIWVEDSFETACGAVTSFPSTTDFTTFLPSVCWSEAVGGDLVTGPTGTTSNWTQDDWLNSTSNTKCAKTNIYSTGGDEWLISETFAIPSSSAYRLKYNVGATQYNSTAAPTIAWGTDDTVQVLISITGTTNWTELVAYNAANVPSHTGQLEIIDLTAYAGQTITIAFRAREGTTSGGDIDFFIDDVTVEEVPLCDVPSSPMSSAVTGNSATLSWTAPTSVPAGYEVAYSITRGIPSAGSPAFATTTNITGLSGLTKYYWYVRSDCGGQYSNWIEDSLKTDISPLSCSAGNAADLLTEDFDNGTTVARWVPSGWTRSSTSTSFGWSSEYNATGTGNTGPSGPYSSTGYLYLETSSGSQGDVDTLTSPVIDLSSIASGAAARLQLRYHMYGANMGDLHVGVKVGGTITILDSLIGQQHSNSSDAWSVLDVDLSAYTSLLQVVILGENGTTSSQYDGDMAIDAFIVEGCVGCLPPVSPSISSVTNNSVTIGWVAPSVPPTGYEYSVSTTSGIPSGGVQTSNLSEVINSLTANTTYYGFVRSDCGGTYSSWVNLGEFTTLCDASTSFCENFDSYSAGSSTNNNHPNCFSILESGPGGSGYAYINSSTSYPSSGSNSFRLYNSSSTSDTLGLVLPELSNISSTSHQLKFYCDAVTTMNVEVGTMMDPSNPSSYTTVTTVPVNTTGQTYIVDLSTFSLTSGHNYIVLRHGNGGTYNSVYFDDVCWEAKPATDATVVAMTSPLGCVSNAETISVTISNNGATAIDFTTNPGKVHAYTTSVPTGATAYIDSFTLMGTLAVGATMSVDMPTTYDMTNTEGVYTFAYNVAVTGDGESTNDAMSGHQVSWQAPVSSDVCENFNAGTSTPSGWSQSGFNFSSSHGNGGNGMYDNMYSASSSYNYWALPKMTVSSGDSLSFDYRIVDYTGYPSTATTIGSHKMYISISTDCGISFTTVDSIHSGNHTTSNSWTRKQLDLNSYASQDIYVIVENIYKGSGDYFVDYDNICVTKYACKTAVSSSTVIPKQYGTATTYSATKECLDYDNWTHYFDGSGTTDSLLLSLKKNGNDIGSVGDGTFAAQVGTGGGAINQTNAVYNVHNNYWQVMNRWFNVTPTNQPTENVGVKFYYTTADYNAVRDSINGDSAGSVASHTDLRHYKFLTSTDPNPNLAAHATVTEPNFIQLYDSSAPSTGKYVYSMFGTNHSFEYEATSFSGGGGAASGGAGPVPVEFIYFQANELGQSAKLDWATATELNNDRFEVYRSFDGVNFEIIGEVAGNGTSNEIHTYEYIDADVASMSSEVYYQLRQVDFDGEFDYTDVRKVLFGKDKFAEDRITITPNPFSNYLLISLDDFEGENATITILDARGREVMVKHLEVSVDNATSILSTDDMPLGVYFINVVSDGVSKTQRMIRTH